MSELSKLSPFLFKWEAGYQNMKEDKANYNSKGILVGTKYGVTPATYENYFKKVPTKADMQNLTPEQASFVMEKYWSRWKASQINSQKIANTLVDWIYLSGTWGIKIPQRLLGIIEDGKVGFKTIAALNETIEKDENKFLNQLYQVRLEYIDNIIKVNATLKKFEKGWKNRLEDLKLYNSKL